MTTIPSPGDLRGARVVIWGAGSHGGGVAAARYCHDHGARVSLLDAKPPHQLPEALAAVARHGWPWHLGELSHPVLRHADLILHSPAIPPRQLARLQAGAPPALVFESLFFAHHRGRRLAVTGTKGKSTTANACAALLDWPLGGNSFRPLLDLLPEIGPDADVVCELSSFQLHHLATQAPRCTVAVLTNLSSDHLDWHADLDEYRRDKQRLLGWADTVVAHDADAAWLPASARQPDDPVLAESGSFRTRSGRLIADRRTCALPGDHNAGNAALALTAALHLGLDPGIAGIRLAFLQPLPHRLQTVHEAGDLRFVDDSIATNPVSTLAAIDAVEGPLAVLLGGGDKGAAWDGLAAALKRRGATAVCLGSTGPRIHAALCASGVPSHLVATLAQAVPLATQTLTGGGTVLLSPACASTDQFRDFAHRGEEFARLARTASL